MHSHSHNFYVTSEALKCFFTALSELCRYQYETETIKCNDKVILQKWKKNIFDAIAEYSCLTFSQDLICKTLCYKRFVDYSRIFTPW